MSASGSKRAIVAALLANAGIAAAKFTGFFITGSSSMLAEGVHSVADTSNQGLLLWGQRQASKEPDALHQFGYGRSRYFYSFVVALVLFTLGAAFALYEGYEKVVHPHELTSPLVAVAILGVAICLEAYSFRTAMVESRPLKGPGGWWHFIRASRNPELPVVLLEDTGALIGLVLALFGVVLTLITGNGVWDGIGTAAIGLLLVVIAVILAIETKSLLLGEGATLEDLRKIEKAILAGSGIERIIHMKTLHLGPEELLVAAKIAVPRTEKAEDLARHIDETEVRIREAVPIARVIYIEPDIYHPRPAPSVSDGAQPAAAPPLTAT
jgi:cation diffusion facilitator family transporter